MTEETATSKAYDSPLRLLVIIAASVFLTEACVMILLYILPPMPHFVAAPLDALLVTLLIYPVLYRYVVRPINRHIDERLQVEDALRRAYAELESRVIARTAELAQANASLQVEIAERQRAGEELKVALDLVQHRQAEMAGLLAGARAVLEYRDFAGMAQPIFEACRSTIGAMAGYVALPTDDQSHEKPVFLSSGEQASALDVFLPMPIVGLSQQAYVTGKTVYTNDPGYYEYAQRLPDGHLPLDNVLFAPMKIRGFVVGTLALANKPDGFSDDDARLAAAFAELAAIAVLNSQTIELLESSERRFRTLAQATFEGIVISEGGIIREANEQFARMHGYTLPQVLGKPVSDLLAPQDYERLRLAIDSDERHVGEYHALRKDGSVFLLEVQAYSTEQSGRIVRVAALRDITERKQAEEAIRARNALLASIIESPDSAIFSIDREYRYTSFNRRHAHVMKALFGADIEIGRNLLDYHSVASDRQSAKQNLDRALSGESFVIEDWAGDDTLTRRCFEIGHSPVKDANQIIGACVVAQDITERKYADQVLRENEEWLRMAFDAGDLGRWRYSVATDMLHLDERARVHSGSHHNTVSQAEALERVHPDDKAILQQEMTDALNPAGHGRYAAEYRVIWPNGETHWLAVQVRVHFEGEGKARQPVLAVGVSQDITTRKRAEEQLRLLSTALETTVNGVVITDREGQILWVNAAFTSLTGYDREEVVGQNPRVLKSGEHHAEFYRKLWEKILRGEPWSGEIINRRKDSTLYYEEMTITPVRAGGNDISHFVAIKEDISARKQAEESLRRQAALIDLSPDAIIVRQLDGIITFWSQGAETLYGWKELEALGRQVSDLLQAQLPQPLGDIVEQLRRTGRWTGEIIHHHRSGLQVIVQSWWLAQFNAYGDITEIFESNVDFTVRKQMEEQLRRTQVLLERRVLERTAELATANNALRLQSTALQAAANGIIITDRQGNIQWANPALTEMTGYAAEEVLGQSTRLFKSGFKEPIFYQHLWNTILSGRVWRGELINRRKDGSLYVEEQTIAPVLNEYGEIANFVAVKQDVTERREAQSRLEQNNRDLLALSEAEHDQRQLAETLAEANLALTTSLNLETVLETLLDCVERLIPYDCANVMLLEAESRLTVRIVRGYERWNSSEQVRAIMFDVQDNPIFNEIVTTRQSRLVSDTRTQPGWESPPGIEHVRCWLGVPLVAGGNVIGLYSLDKTEPGFFTPEHVRKAEMLAGQAAVAVQNAWLFEQVRAGRERLQTLSRRLVDSQEAERQYIARELHDEAGQALTSLLFGLGQLEQQIDSSVQAAQIAELRQTINDIIESLHRLAMDLRPASLDHLGLVPALLQQVRVIGDRHGLIARFKAVGLEHERLPAEVETTLYRIVQEALTNVVRHAQATRVDVLLERRGDRIVVVVEDNGRGFDAEITRFMQEGHLGLTGIQERAKTLGGSLIIESTAGIGTTLAVEVPYGDSHPDR